MAMLPCRNDVLKAQLFSSAFKTHRCCFGTNVKIRFCIPMVNCPPLRCVGLFYKSF
ncbi:hypothetical protein HMPREF9554_00401 [Treponema phagedenis F0421]|nr:hypothetical protein HMPREF9554_00401 [Treponema phagedenis F0421]